MRFIRDSTFGRLIYRFSRHKYLSYPEEQPDYCIGKKYLPEFSAGPVITTWDGPDDPENPINMPNWQKHIFYNQIGYLTLSIYMCAAIYSPAAASVQQHFGLNDIQASLPLVLFVLGYGIGPLFLSPASEMATVGRSSIYVASLGAYFIFSTPIAFTDNFPLLCVMRFITGFVGSPAMATGGASYCDLLYNSYEYLDEEGNKIPHKNDTLWAWTPIGMAYWGVFSFLAMAVAGPLIGAGLVETFGWRSVFVFMWILSGFNFVFFGLFLPETSYKTLLYRKAARLRTLTGNKNITSSGEVEIAHMTPKELTMDLLVRPFELSVLEPVVILINIYISMIYALIYLLLDSFPRVFVELRHFTLVQMAGAFFSIALGVFAGAAHLVIFMHYKFSKKVLANEYVPPEVYEHPWVAFVGALLAPIGIFIFAWSSTLSVHWMVSMVGGFFIGHTLFMGFQCQLNYLCVSFPRYVASVMASNDFFRSLIGALVCLAGGPLYYNLGSEKYPFGWGGSVLGFVALALCFVPIFFYANGVKLRAKSKYAN